MEALLIYAKSLSLSDGSAADIHQKPYRYPIEALSISAKKLALKYNKESPKS
jgi:hypothetical protein